MLEANGLPPSSYTDAGHGEDDARSLVAQSRKKSFERNAAGVGVKEVRASRRGRGAPRNSGQRTSGFIDEINRFNRAQQDFLLGDVDGRVHPRSARRRKTVFAVNSALIRRSKLQFAPLSEDDIRRRPPPSRQERGFGKSDTSDKRRSNVGHHERRRRPAGAVALGLRCFR